MHKQRLPRLVFATNNPHKLEEVRNMAGDKIEILSLSEIGCRDDIPETADTLEGNALQKACWVKEHYGFDCFADDTGLMVDALNGAPGVYTARYAGENCTPAENVDKLLLEMQDLQNRNARFATAIALITGDKTYSVTGEVTGFISTERRGTDGFGYDPVFIPEETAPLTFAQAGSEVKNRISHRAKAISNLIRLLDDIYRQSD